MAFYVFSNGDVADGEGEVNPNFNEVLYAILYNRMENDAQATAPQLNANIQSDLFSCAAGKYSTVCTAETTSTFSTNLYNNCCACTYPQCACMTCCLVCVVCPTYGTLTNTQSGLNICSVYQISQTSYGVCVCQNVTSCGTLPSIVDYKRINILINFCGSWQGCVQCVYKCWGFGTSVLSNNITYNFGVRTCIGCNSGCFSCNNCVVLTYLCNNCYTVCINGCCVCNISGDTSLSINNWNCMCNTNCEIGSGGWWACNSACSNIQIIGWSTLSTSIVSSIKNYATPKNAVMLVTNSVLPAGNCVRYDIKNQADCTYLSDAEPDKVYNLCASDSCCFYAVIKQCIECNLCTPQCMTQYALMYM